MTVTEARGAQGDANFPSAPSAGFLRRMAIAALLAFFASLLPGIPAAEAQTPGSTRLESMMTLAGMVYHRWSDNNGASWSPWTSLGNPPGIALTEIPAVISDGAEHIYVIAASYNPSDDPLSILNGGIWYNTAYSHGASWNGWTRIPGQDAAAGRLCTASQGCTWVPAGSPAIASWGPGRVDLFVAADNSSGGSRALLHTWADNDVWSGTWEALQECTCAADPPGAVSWGQGRIDVFWHSIGGAPLGIPDSVKHIWFDNSQWSAIQDLGAPPDTATDFNFFFPITSPPVAASPGYGRLTVFTRGQDGHLYGNQVNSNVWSGWFDIGCCLAVDVFFDSHGELQLNVMNSVAAISLATNSLDAFVIGTDHALYRKTYTFSAGWAPWQFVDASTSYTQIAVAGWVPIAPPPPPPPPSGGGGGGGGCRRPCVLPP